LYTILNDGGAIMKKIKNLLIVYNGLNLESNNEDKNVKDLDSLISLREAISKLKDRERDVLLKRYIDGLSQSEIASLLSISQAQVSRIENNALNSVKKLIM
jgi:RNA polymerase sporulation-specific sigma factor